MPRATPGFDAFWRFALGRWEHPPARQRLLHWQDAYDVDVILALLALWYPGGVRGQDWEGLMQVAALQRRQTTTRVRSIRRRLKPDGPDEPRREALYDAVKGLEIACERTSALHLYQRLRVLGSPAATPDFTRRLHLLFPALAMSEIRDGLPELARSGCT